MKEKFESMPKPLIVRYQMFTDDRGQTLRDQERIAELVWSLTSLKLYLEPHVELHVVIYTLTEFLPRLNEVLSVFSFANHSVLDVTNDAHLEFASTIEHCTFIDRICIRRMLSDFSILPTDQFRLLVGTDVAFYRPPVELFEFMKNPGEDQVLYMIDDRTFGGEPYTLTYYDGEMLKGLLGDFYCLGPGVSLSEADVQSCLKMIDSWPPEDRWRPDPGLPSNFVHACEQQAAAILLGRFRGHQLPTSTYHHVSGARGTGKGFSASTVAHAHSPWYLIILKAMPPLLAENTIEYWKKLGLHLVVKNTTYRGAFIGLIKKKSKLLLAQLKGKIVRFKEN